MRIPGCVYLILILAHPALGQTKYRLAEGFSSSSNPNSVWQIGFSASLSLSPDQFRISQYADTTERIVFWHPTKSEGNGPGYYPYVAFNPTSQSRTTSANGWALRPGQAALEAANDGAYSVVRFLAPASGYYRVSAAFEGIHYRLSSTDVHVLHNDNRLFDGIIEGYGGDPAFHPVEGLHPAASWTGTVRLNKGDTISFAVGVGLNRTHYNDTTGLQAEVEQLREPQK
jgi:hypothetical protein